MQVVVDRNRRPRQLFPPFWERHLSSAVPLAFFFCRSLYISQYIWRGDVLLLVPTAIRSRVCCVSSSHLTSPSLCCCFFPFATSLAPPGGRPPGSRRRQHLSVVRLSAAAGKAPCSLRPLPPLRLVVSSKTLKVKMSQVQFTLRSEEGGVAQLEQQHKLASCSWCGEGQTASDWSFDLPKST